MPRIDLRPLVPGAFAVVMASGILSIGTALLGPSWLSRAFLVIAAVVFGACCLLSVLRLLGDRATVLAELRDPSRAFGYFAVVA
ncbi:MAG: tellurite resistance/C4-dicarboxylate transporter family protein, partial [Nitrososphaerales archaeon]